MPTAIPGPAAGFLQQLGLSFLAVSEGHPAKTERDTREKNHDFAFKVRKAVQEYLRTYVFTCSKNIVLLTTKGFPVHNSLILRNVIFLYIYFFLMEGGMLLLSKTLTSVSRQCFTGANCFHL